MKEKISLRVNGIEESLEIEANRTLLEVLRDDLNLTGAKEGCNEGECGACMVLLNGKAINTCLTLAVEADGGEITTIEGLADRYRQQSNSSAELHPLQESFLRFHAVQCGYCTPGMIITAAALLERSPEPSEAEIRTALAGNLCRCTGYRQIIDAVHDAARNMEKQA